MSATEIMTTSGQFVTVDGGVASVRGRAIPFGTQVVGMDPAGAVRIGEVSGFPTETCPVWWVRVGGVQTQFEHAWPV